MAVLRAVLACAADAVAALCAVLRTRLCILVRAADVVTAGRAILRAGVYVLTDAIADAVSAA